MKGHRTFKKGEIRKQHKKTKGVRNNSSKEAIKKGIQQDKEEEIVKTKGSRDNKTILS
jgi:hypothetical protein